MDADPAEPPVSVVVADGHPVIRGGLRAMLSTQTRYRVLADADNARDTVRAVTVHRPDVVVIDLDLGGVAAITEIRRCGARVLVFTMADEDAAIVSALQAGAGGYIRKNASPEQITRAICGVAAGDVVLGPPFAARLAELLLPVPTVRTDLPDLTAREREVLSLVVEGLPNSAIARRLTLAPKTISNHLSVIFGKLQVASRADAVILARQAGW
ncbi:response regulator transcription factor [Kribbella ginsengisoli]|uniref:Response regulator transcription factor n=1 Tax=Kribbella ginsengisoli TaxID=363865 RepID=A0ABP6Y7W9_9ACTN